jgi:hypothetical protein
MICHDVSQMDYPGVDQQDQLRDLIMQYSGIGRQPRQHKLLLWLFQDARENGLRRIGSTEIATACSIKEDNVRHVIHRLREFLPEFFKHHVSVQKNRWWVGIHSQEGYALHFYKNPSLIEDDGLVWEFWKPYVSGSGPIRLMYPEPQFFRDKRNTYFRNQDANTADKTAVFSYLTIEGRVRPSFSYVSAGTVHAVLSLVEYFHRLSVPCTTTACRPESDYPGYDEHVVWLGTPHSVTTMLEGTRPIIIEMNRIKFHKNVWNDRVVSSNFRIKDIYRDEVDEVGTGTRWAVLTRCESSFVGRSVTVIAAKHGRTVQAVMKFLTHYKELNGLQTLMQDLSSPKKPFPDHSCPKRRLI